MVVRGCGGGVERGRGWYGVNRVGGVGLEEVNGLFIMCGAKEWVLREMDKGKIFGCEGVNGSSVEIWCGVGRGALRRNCKFVREYL